MSDIPPEIITVILVRLPVKSLLRFRCVSKSWRSLIDGDYFVKLHLRHSAETNSNRTLIMESTKLFYLDLDSFERLDTGNLRFNSGYVSGTCNGLVLIVSMRSDVVFLWNPSTRKLNEVPQLKLNPDFYKLYGIWLGVERYALGYDSKHDDYKVVGVARAYDGETLFSETKIYSLKTNSWKKVGDFPCISSGSGTWGIYLNDAVHAVVELESDHCSVEVIMALDLANEDYYEVSKPESAGVGCRLASVGVLVGCLAAVVVYGETNIVEIWVMKEYGVKGSWCKLICFDPSVPEILRVNLCPLACSKSGDEVLLNFDGMCLGWYDFGSKNAVVVACVEGMPDFLDAMTFDSRFDAWVCVASLVSPFKQSTRKGKEIKKKRDDFLSVGFKLVL
ncbi:F-box protein cpr30 [Phtheirospermum japonicum]|uniref:F-box protein cpr30 n=1 Tax=Phtheirospermum japonicum TaxID=374723 RepID=A0A830D5X6_9LAMI|nr:F-box protein cpr30 [Phtheirospermum japonicum]